MPKALYLPGADRTSKWFAPLFDGRVFTTLEKQLLHSTETDKRWGCPGYDSGKKAPTFTINPWPGYQRIWQHFPVNESARALLNPAATTVSENKDNVCQWEIIGYSDRSLGIARGCYLPDLPGEGLDYLARALAFVSREWGVPNTWADPWPMYPASYGASPARMTSTEYDEFRGFLGHLHASGNTHGDPSLNIPALRSRVGALLNPTSPQEDDMPTVHEVWTTDLTKTGTIGGAKVLESPLDILTRMARNIEHIATLAKAEASAADVAAEVIKALPADVTVDEATLARAFVAALTELATPKAADQ